MGGESSAGEPADVHARLAFARDLTHAGRYEEALVEHLWLWEHMLEYEPAMVGVRTSFFAADLQRLVNDYAPARIAIGELRDRAAPSPSGPIEVEPLHDWVCLNSVLGEAGRTLAWYDALPPRRRARLGAVLEHALVPVLIDDGRWADAGALYEKPLETLNTVADSLAAVGSYEHRAEVIEHMREHFRWAVARLVRALCAAGRDADANLVERRAGELDMSAEMANALANARSTPA